MPQPTIRRGDAVEFTDSFQRDYTTGDPQLARYGIATEDTNNMQRVFVMLADRSIVVVRHVQAFAWAGWVPEDLEEIQRELSPSEFDDEDDYL